MENPSPLPPPDDSPPAPPRLPISSTSTSEIIHQHLRDSVPDSLPVAPAFDSDLYPQLGLAAPADGSDQVSRLGSAAPADGSAAPADGSGPPVIPFQPSLGAWSKPLKILASSTLDPPSKGIQSAANQDIPSHLLWPSLVAGQGKPKNIKAMPGSLGSNRAIAPSVDEIYIPEVKEDGQLRFPWAAKMDPSKRNLFRTTSPSYLEDGTPKVTIPSRLLLHGPENQKEYIIGQFFRCLTPSGGLVNAVVNRIWGKRCKIFTRKLGDSSYLFHIPDESTRSWILHRGLWHVDDCLMFVGEWSPTTSLSPPEISTAPVWVTLKNIPHTLYSLPGISRIASGLGEPMLTHKPRLDPSLMGEAKILVEVELDKPFPQIIACDDKYGSLFLVDVEYSWIPSQCGRCGHLGHKEPRCLQLRDIVTPIVSVQDPIVSVQDPITETITTTIPATCQAPITTTSPTVCIPPLEKLSPPHFVHPAASDVSSFTPPNVPVNGSTPIGSTSTNKKSTSSKVDNSPYLIETHTRFVLIDPSGAAMTDDALASASAPSSPAIASPRNALTPATETVLTTHQANSSTPLVTNQEETPSGFKLLGFSVSDEDTDGSDSEACMFDTMTPSGYRLLRERPVKPSFKALEMQASSKARGRGSRGRGNQGGRG